MGVKLAGVLGLAIALGGCRTEQTDLGGGPPPFECDERCFVDRTVAEFHDAPADWFWGDPTDSSKPEVVYPLEGSVHAVNFEELTVQWRRRDRGQTLFALRFFASELEQSYIAYVPCLATDGEGCRYQLPDGFFARLRNAFQGQNVELTVAATDGAGGPVTTSRSVGFRFTSKNLENKGFYYWGTTDRGQDTVGLTYRLAAGARRPDPFIRPSTPSTPSLSNPLECGGCHSVSRDGSTIAFTARPNYSLGDNVGQLVVALTRDPTRPIIPADPALPDTAYNSSMMALTRDGSRALVAFGGGLELRDVQGGLLPEIPAALLQGKHALFPEFSPTDRRVVFTLAEELYSSHAVKDGSIATLVYDDERAELRDLEILVESSADEFHFYPTWSPDEQYIAFVTAPRGEYNASANQKNARLRMVRVADKQPFELAAATQGIGHWSTLPKFAPFQPADHGGLMFLTFTSKIDYGLLLRNGIPEQDDDRLPQLWMTAIDPGRLPGGDPSSAPVWLPFQNFVNSSLFGYWTDQVACRLGVRDAQGQELLPCGPGESCFNGSCRYIPN